jgi:hypothetical protein
MLGFVLAALVGLPAPQDTSTVDAPVYVNEAYGVSLPRPFDDWVFEPATDHQTTTVIFLPRSVPASEQFLGALGLTRFASPVALERVASQRVEGTWRGRLGRSFELLGRDSLSLAGWPAVRVLMSGAINHVAVDVEEYMVARDSDLILLQFRYPRGLPRDSIAAGYRRVVGGLRIRGATALAPPPPPALADSVAAAGVVPPSPWEAAAYDALVRFDAPRARADIAVRMDLVNSSVLAADSVAIWLWPAFVLDSVRGISTNWAVRTNGSVSWVRLPDAIQPLEGTSFTAFYHVERTDRPLPSRLLGIAPEGAYVATNWLPRVQPERDSAGQAVPEVRARMTLRFDLPAEWSAVAAGRLTSDATSLGRRRMTWRTDQMTPALPAFALGPYRVLTRREQGVAVSVWLTPVDSLSSPDVDSLAAAIRAAWGFCGRVFGRLPVDEVNVAATAGPGVHGFASLIMIRHPTGPTPSLSVSTLVNPRLPTFAALAREVARTWWGTSVAAAGTGSAWILESFPAWAAMATQAALQGDTVRVRLVREAEEEWRALPPGGDAPLSQIPVVEASTELLQSKGVAAIEAARRVAGEARFREALFALAVEHRNSWITIDDVLAALGPAAAAVLRPYLY